MNTHLTQSRRFRVRCLSLSSLALLLCACASTTPTASVAPTTKSTTSATESTLQQFAILMYETGDAWNRLPKAEQDALMEKYMAWIKDLRASGHFKDGAPMGRGGVQITLDATGEADADPLDPNAPSLTGFFIVEVKDAAQAEHIAATCPALLHGETVHVRPIGHE